jgi:hypothetical protein
MIDFEADIAGDEGRNFEDRMLRGLNVVTTAMLAGTTVMLLLGTAAAVRDAFSPAPERVQSELVRGLQDGHGAYAGGISDGMTMAGAVIPDETRDLLRSVVPDQSEIGTDRQLDILRNQGLEAGMSGGICLAALHDYALFINTLPASVGALSAEAEHRLSEIAGEAGVRLARMAVIAGLLSETGEVRGVALNGVIRTLAAEVPSAEVEAALIETAYEAVGLREAGGVALPDAATMTGYLSYRISCELDRLVAADASPAP